MMPNYRDKQSVPTQSPNSIIMIDENSSFCRRFFDESAQIAQLLDAEKATRMVAALVELRQRKGRLFILGAGGSAGNSSHAVNDFRKLCGIEAYSPTDNSSELTARINDEGWDTAFVEWLRISNLQKKDALLVFSVGGGSIERNVSIPIVNALKHGKNVGAVILGIVGRDGGFTKSIGTEVLVVPNVNDKLVTPHSEAFQAIVWHCLVSHPLLQIAPTKW